MTALTPATGEINDPIHMGRYHHRPILRFVRIRTIILLLKSYPLQIKGPAAIPSLTLRGRHTRKIQVFLGSRTPTAIRLRNILRGSRQPSPAAFRIMLNTLLLVTCSTHYNTVSIPIFRHRLTTRICYQIQSRVLVLVQWQITLIRFRAMINIVPQIPGTELPAYNLDASSMGLKPHIS
jgi:hypothetical protein